ncbi:hypothetical protein LSH36_645g00004 [Paralvinella palmiformis]|uniref:Uncharacterized protein n=1 Tax=Paralvinella palmiformis TaxID=53620 RepID=A0AAD9J4E4_9ANNE|nr:hypothetical protein LSH36_645g00004 [Paralvinella palmiformis]
MPHYNINIVDIPEFVLNKSLLDPIQANLPLRCNWCLENPTEASLNTMLNEIIANWKERVPQNMFSNILSDAEIILSEYMNISWLQDAGVQVEKNSIELVRARFKAMMKTVKESDTETQSVIEQMADHETV